MPHDVVLVEDNHADAVLVSAAFDALGIEVELRVADRVATAVELVRTQLPELVLLDLNLPGQDGYAVLRELRADPRTRLVPVIVFTSSEAPVDLTRSYHLGANAYVVKPMGYAELEEVLGALAAFWFTVATGPPRDPSST